MRTFRMTVAYDGTAFHGWQVQPGLRTVQGELERAIEEATGERTRVHGAGRTDAGVHARGQVASFELATDLPARALGARLARRLPPDVAVRALVEAPAGFHARHSATGRRYAYRLLKEDDVLLGRFAWRPRQPVRPAALERATRALEGEHDFSAFQSVATQPPDPRCRVSRARWLPWEGGWRLDIVSDHFLYHMVRAVVGTALAVSAAADPAAAMRAVLASRDRARAGSNAPAHGLCLEQVFYGEDAA
uniref:tRNA pseudouridine synthase A n=1 Tax=Eiseniibacteriota bacterium TaxID=2212470 RepID=A0A832I5F7_UNCEI